MQPIAHIHITPASVRLNDEPLPTEANGRDLLTELYRAHVADYPKFFKMDTLSRLGFIAIELLLNHEATQHPEATPRFEPRDDRAVVLCNRSASLCTDRHYQHTIQCADEFFPSPSVFVYTLPNIVTGEIAIRNKFYGETSFYVLEHQDDAEINRLIAEAALDTATHSVIGGWLECAADDDFTADIWLYC
jgi:3-oxoacyl-[acyl-carrier-protein] synthase-1